MKITAFRSCSELERFKGQFVPKPFQSLNKMVFAVLFPQFDPLKPLDVIMEYEVTVTGMVPTMIICAGLHEVGPSN